MTHSDVIVRRGPAAVVVKRESVYFAFASGRLGYNCMECGYQCCRGHGYDLHAGPELKLHVAARPGIELFLDSGPQQDRYAVRNCPPACFFLTDSGRCGLQAEHGYDAKPETCRLFPFNYIHHVGDHVIVAPHPALCPLSVVPKGGSAAESDHEHLFEDMARHGIKTHVPVWPTRAASVAALVAREREVVAASERHLDDQDYVRFAVEQLIATRSVNRHENDVWPREEPSAWRCERFLDLVAELVGGAGPRRPGSAEMTRTLVACTHALRAELIFGRGDVCVDQVPYVLLALGVLASAAEQAGMRRVTYQTVMRLFRDYLPLLVLLSLIDRHVVWRQGVAIPLSCGNRAHQERYVRIARALLPSARAGQPLTLEQILQREMSADGMARLSLLKMVARCCAGNLVINCERPHGHGRVRWSSVRPAVQRLALRLLSEDVLAAVAARHAHRGAH